MWERINKLMNEKGVTAYKLSKDTGIRQASLSDWKKGNCKPGYASIKILSEYFGVPISFITDGEEKKEVRSYPVGSLVSMPVIGTVKAGYGGYCSEEYTGEYFSITTDDLKGYPPTECRILRVTGDSMYPVIVDGDTVIVHVQPDVDDDEIAVILNGENEATLKAVRKKEDSVELIPKNPEYKTKIISKKEFAEGRYRIYGKVLRLMREF